VLGDKEFKEEKRQESQDVELKHLQYALDDRPSVPEVIKIVSQIMKVSEKTLYQRGNGQRKNSPERAFAIYACQRYSGANYREIADNFGLKHVGSLSHSLNRIRKEINGGGWQSVIKDIETKIYIVKYT
jgi:chromosomal replication initiation ATPase DnaA